jgi:hypothetical protein
MTTTLQMTAARIRQSSSNLRDSICSKDFKMEMAGAIRLSHFSLPQWVVRGWNPKPEEKA